MKIAMLSRTGGRSNNEDAVKRARRDGKYCFALADGIGGQKAGEVASQLAVDTVIECFMSQSEISADMMYSYLEAAQNAIIEKRAASPKCSNMGTTIAVLLTDSQRAVWGHCGDSRIYRFKRNLIQEITDDHSAAFISFMTGEITYDEIRRSPDQNKLLRSLSDGEKFKPDISGPVKLPSHSSFLICTDGFWEYVDEDFMEKTRKKSKTPKEWLSAMVARRDKLAPHDSDNYSAIAVYV